MVWQSEIESSYFVDTQKQDNPSRGGRCDYFFGFLSRVSALCA
jgi:hypothetical protein